MSILTEASAALVASSREAVESIADFYAYGAPTYPLLAVGVRTATDLHHRHKILDAAQWPHTDSELARPYLRTIWEAQRPSRGMGKERVPFRKQAFGMLEWPAPLYYAGGRHRGDYAYVDLAAAYWNLYAPATLDIDYQPGEKLALGRIRFLEASELAAHKAARNTLVGITRSLSMRVSRYGQVSTEPTNNKLLAPALWGYLSDTLHAIAVEAVESFHAIYVHTDGYIVPTGEAAALCDHVSERWAIGAKIVGHSRVATVWGMGRYRCGTYRSRHSDDGSAGEAIDNLWHHRRDEADRLAHYRQWLMSR